MSDLISRSELISRIESEYIEYGEDYDVEQILGDIEDMPTAYSVGKIVEEFDKKYNNSLWIKGNEEFSITRNELIEIVNHGGVSDDVCECRLLKGYKFLHKTSCCDVFDMENGFKYCPYCGKEIKVVE